MSHDENIKFDCIKDKKECVIKIFIFDDITVKMKDRCIFIAGKLGQLHHRLYNSIDARVRDLQYIEICERYFDIHNKAIMGTTRSLINNMMRGVRLGFSKKLKLVGIGYRVFIENNILNLYIGLSHTIKYQLPLGITATCLNQNEIVLFGFDKQLVGQIAANLRVLRPPNPFKGKGIRYIDEMIRYKDSKKR